jgi:hypothetical protein
MNVFYFFFQYINLMMKCTSDPKSITEYQCSNMILTSLLDFQTCHVSSVNLHINNQDKSWPHIFFKFPQKCG